MLDALSGNELSSAAKLSARAASDACLDSFRKSVRERLEKSHVALVTHRLRFETVREHLSRPNACAECLLL